ncbi:diguanylate cyclase/phosphodiesterase [Colwellia psychrerythraea]|uniref:Diguanylate cyclase/phosphodiesterase n=2 Tax=Colwellia psychrerythraea TaxID=28229 RepID=A0A099KEH2_COLPS|nr:diguanylate cyclase/phosphodiesterase [Colwellia psychrerythraea]
MASISKPYLLRASLLAAFAIFMGLALSFVVYQSTENVKTNAIDLVSNRIPILTSINELMADLSEQERVIYEYYRSQENDSFLKSSAVVKNTFNMHLAIILKQIRFEKEAAIIVKGQQDIEVLFDNFYQAMQVDEDNWDEMRVILTKVSTIRRQLLPTLKSIEMQTKKTVDEGHQATLKQMAISHWLVIVYGIAIVLIAGITSWYLRLYMLTQAKNTRLALFSHRNPNPILSVNNLGEVVFANPACDKLLVSVGYKAEEVEYLLPNNFLSLRQQLSSQNEHNSVVEQVLNDHVLHISVYWHEEIDAYDIHIKDVTERKLAEERVNLLAFYNQATNLPNQYKFNNDIDNAIKAGEKFSIGIFSIRSFDEKVSALGLEATEALVNTLAKNISLALPTGVLFYQTNDSQFGLLCSKSNNSLALQQLTKLVSDVAEQPLLTQCGEFFVELDFGYGCYPIHGDDRNFLIKSAHNALVIASEDEHNNFCLYEPRFSENSQKNIELINKLRHAVAKKELFLVFQPQLDIQSNRVTGIETLVRWRHGGDIISPVNFIPLAEQSGLIIPIGQWILEQACQFAKQLVDLGYIDIIVAVNVSPRQFTHPQFCHSVRNALADVGLPPHNLELEITEGVFMHNEEVTLAVLQQLKSTGLHLSIDDFGTGYSSLSYLKRFPIDKLKIDQSFIRDCHENDEDRAIIKTIVSLGKSLNLSLIAEGVEEESHVDFLRGLGCEEIQGYWFSKPILPEQLISLLAEQGGDIKVESAHYLPVK